MNFYIKIKKTFWKEMRFKREIKEQIVKLLEADDAYFMTEEATRIEILKTNPVPIMEIKCYTCASFVSNPYPMKHECRKTRNFINGEDCCLEWRSGKLAAQKRILDSTKEKIRRKQENEDAAANTVQDEEKLI